MAEEINIEKCNLRKLTASDLDLDLGLGHSHMSIAIHRSSSMPDHVTVYTG